MSATFPKSSLALVAALAVAAFGSGCANKSQPLTGNAKLSISTPLLQGVNIPQVARVDLSITGGTPAIAPISATLTKAPSGIQWTGNITGIPAVSGLTFQGTAYSDAAGTNVLYQGSTTASITAGATATIVILLQEKNPTPGPTNFAPVISAVTSTSSTVTPGTVVGIGFSASDPANNYPLAYQWTASCAAPAATSGAFATAAGSLTAPVAPATTVGANTTWTAPATNNVLCTIGIQVTDNNTVQGKSSVQTFFTIQVISNTGAANVVAFPNSYPIINVFRGDIAYNFDSTATTSVGSVGQRGNIYATATDPDGDNIRYTFQVKCGNPLPASIAVGTDLTSSLSFATLNTVASGTSANPTWFYADPSQSCIFGATVNDLCTAGNCGNSLPVGTPGRLADGADRGGVTTGFINFTAPSKPVKAPFVIRTSAPNTSGASGQTVINPSTVYNFGIEASDPEGGNLSVAWTSNVGTISAPVNTVNLKSTVQYTSAASLLPSMSLNAAITSSKSGLTTTVTFALIGSDPCIGKIDGTACSTGNLCVQSQVCTAGVCGGGSPTVCAGADQCNTASCSPNTGCSVAPKPTTTTCSTGNLCLSGTTCGAPVAPSTTSVCGGGSAVVCATPAQCYTQAACVPATGCPAPAPAASGTTCSTGNGCTTANACNGTGTCVGTAVTCSQTTNPCQSTSGTCTSTSATTFTCGYANVTNGTACNTAGACVTGQTCTTGSCGGGTPFCAAGTSCNPVGPVCVDSVVTPQVANSVQLNNFKGNVFATNGSTYVTGLLIGTKTFGTVTLTSAGAGDVFVGKYNPDGTVAFAVRYGDASDQQPTAISTGGSIVATIGQFNGALGTLNNTGTAAIDYLLAVDPTTGGILWNKSFDLGLGGNLSAVAVSSTGNVAICGLAVQAATQLVPGAVYGGLNDVVIGMFDSTGVLKWSTQYGTANNEACSALAWNAAGTTLYAAGKYDGSGTVLGFTGTPLPVPGSSFRKHLWVASFTGATGVPLAQVSFGSGAGSHLAEALAVDGSGNVILAGSFTNSIPFGAFTAGTACTATQPGCFVASGTSDALVAKLTSALAPTFATRIGSAGASDAKGVAVDSYGNIVTVGVTNGSSTASSLTPTTVATAAVTALTTPSVNSAAFLAKLPGASGIFNAATASVYGNTTNAVGANTVSINNAPTGTALLNQVAFGGTYNGTLSFGGASTPISTTTGGAEDFLVFAKEQ